MIEGEYGVEDIERVTGIPRRTLQRWAVAGYLPASKSTGSGKQRRYTHDDLRRAQVMAALRRGGVRQMDRVTRLADSILAALDRAARSENFQTRHSP